MKYHVRDTFRNKCGNSVDDDDDDSVSRARVISPDRHVKDGRRLWSEAKRAREGICDRKQLGKLTSQPRLEQLLVQLLEVLSNTFNNV